MTLEDIGGPVKPGLEAFGIPLYLRPPDFERDS